MNSTEVNDRVIKRSSKRILIFALVITLWHLLTSWVCLLGSIQPHRWLLAASVARWLWIIVYSAFALWGFFGLVMSRLALKPKRPYLSQKNWSTFFCFFILVFLLIGRLEIAVSLLYAQGAREAIRRLRLSPDESIGETRQFLQFHSGCKLLAFAFCMSVLATHSFPALLCLFSFDTLAWLAPLPLIPKQLVSIQSQIQTQTKHSNAQTT